jgi:ribose transport system substrate-binding protein
MRPARKQNKGKQGEEAMIKMSRIFTFFAVTLAWLSAGLLAGTAFAQSKRVALLVGPTQDRFIGTWAKAFSEAAPAKGFAVTVFSSPWDPALQSQQIDDAVAQRFDALVVQTLSQKAVIPALIRAKNAKVPVITIISQFRENDAQDLHVTYVGENSRLLGQRAGEALGQALAKAGRSNAKVAALVGTLSEGTGALRTEGFKAAIAKFPGVELVLVEDVQWNPTKAEQAFGQILARFGGTKGLDAVYGMNDTVANGAIQAAESAGVKLGLEKGSLIVVGGNCMAPGIKNVQSGRQTATVLMLPHISARNAADVAADVLAGKQVARSVYETHEIITKDNVANFVERCTY